VAGLRDGRRLNARKRPPTEAASTHARLAAAGIVDTGRAVTTAAARTDEVPDSSHAGNSAADSHRHRDNRDTRDAAKSGNNGSRQSSCRQLMRRAEAGSTAKSSRPAPNRVSAVRRMGDSS
jgi:hypothetical protein